MFLLIFDVCHQKHFLLGRNQCLNRGRNSHKVLHEDKEAGFFNLISFNPTITAFNFLKLVSIEESSPKVNKIQCHLSTIAYKILRKS